MSLMMIFEFEVNVVATFKLVCVFLKGYSWRKLLCNAVNIRMWGVIGTAIRFLRWLYFDGQMPSELPCKHIEIVTPHCLHSPDL